MKTERTDIIFAVLTAVIVMAPSFSRAQQSTVEERIAALKATLAASHAALRQYQWIETTTVIVKGEEKSRKQEQRFYYCACGKLTKVLLTDESAQEDKKRGIRGRIAEKKDDELTDYIHDAVVLIRQYILPDQTWLQAAKDSGKVSIHLTEPRKQARLTFSYYLKSGASLALDMDLTNTNRLPQT